MIALPEFFTSGMAFDPRTLEAVDHESGQTREFLLDLADRHSAIVGGSFLCRLDSGEIRNRYLLAEPGRSASFHDKDIPTMWENCYYGPGRDDGVLNASVGRIGVALCWEMMRSQTVRRMRGRVDMLVGASGWWSVPDWWPQTVWGLWQRRNARNAADAPRALAGILGVPMVHGALCGALECDTPLMPTRYRGHFEGGAVICDARGRTLARRPAALGAGIVEANVDLRRATTTPQRHDGYWLHRRGAIAATAWALHGWHGRRWRRKADLAAAGALGADG